MENDKQKESPPAMQVTGSVGFSLLVPILGCSFQSSFVRHFLKHILKLIQFFQPTMTPAGGLSLFQPDWMHTKCLGTDSHLLGSCLAYLVKEILPGTCEENVAQVWTEVKEYYATNRVECRLGNLTWNMIKNDPFPRLSAKAMETKCLVPVVRDLLQRWIQDPIVAWMHRLLLLSSEMDTIVFGNKAFLLGPNEGQTLCKMIFEYNVVLTALARNLHKRAMAYMNYTPKNHYLCHIGLHASKSGINPRLAWCFQGEDFMAVVKSLCVASGRGVASSMLINKVVAKYLRGVRPFAVALLVVQKKCCASVWSMCGP